MIDLQKALEELGQKSYSKIQTETAWTWASRACACYEYCVKAEEGNRLAWWSLGEEYFHEAAEHAALVADSNTLLQEVRNIVRPYQDKAANLLGSKTAMYDQL